MQVAAGYAAAGCSAQTKARSAAAVDLALTAAMQDPGSAGGAHSRPHEEGNLKTAKLAFCSHPLVFAS